MSEPRIRDLYPSEFRLLVGQCAVTDLINDIGVCPCVTAKSSVFGVEKVWKQSDYRDHDSNKST